MSFFAYTASSDGIHKIDYKTRNDAAGVIGTLLPTSAPTATADDRDSITEKAYAHVGRNPSDLVYIADSEGLLYEVIKTYNAQEDKLLSWLFAAGWLFALSVICFLTTIVFGFGIYGFLFFVGGAVLYLLLVLGGVCNAMEGAVTCSIILILLFLLIPAITAVRKVQKPATNATSPIGISQNPSSTPD